MIAPRWLLALLAPVLLALAGCGGGARACFDDRSCASGERCNAGPPGEPGTCGPCDDVETPYDGIDNDCSGRTRDEDLDGDGDNAATAAVRPGGDCDDAEPAASSLLPETCGDGKDNDCDGQFDEPECGDFEPPTVAFLAPAAGTAVAGVTALRIETVDDVGVVRVSLESGGMLLEALDRPASPRQVFELELDTARLPDGRVELRALAQDVRGRTAVTTLELQVDNRTAPAVAALSPRAGGSYAGRLRLEAEATDASGVARVEFSIDGAPVATLTAPPYLEVFDTSALAEGMHRVVTRAFDAFERESSVETAIMIDRTGPVVAFASPAAGAIVTGEAVEVLVEASDPAGVSTLAAGGRAAQGPAARSLRYTLDSTTVRNGPLTLSARAEDATVVDDGASPGNVSTARVEVVVANIPAPTLRLAPRYATGGTLGTAGYDLADLDGDGLVDAVAAGSSLSVMTATVGIHGFGFGPARRVSAEAALDVLAVDVDLDGALDLVALAPSGLRVHRGDGAGGFGPATPVPAGQGVTLAVMECGDLDGDADVDCVAAGAAVTGLVFLNDGGTLRVGQRFGGNASVVDLALADVDLDGDRDVVVGRSGASNNLVTVFRNGGTATFGAGQDSPTLGGPEAVEVTDADGDGTPDLLAMQPTTPGQDGPVVQILRGLPGSPGNFGGGTLLRMLREPRGMALGDVDLDGTRDLVVASSYGNGVEVWRGVRGGFEPWRLYHLADGARRPRVVDLDGDRDQDVVVASGPANGLFVGIGVGRLGLGAPPVVRLAEAPRALAAGDIGGSALPDLVVALDRAAAAGGAPARPPRLVFLENTAARFVSQREHPLPAGVTPPSAIAVGDLDGLDGLDLAVGSGAALGAGANPDPTAAAILNRGAWTFESRPFAIDRPQRVAIGDVDGDQLGELLVTTTSMVAGRDGARVVQLDGSGEEHLLLNGDTPVAIIAGDVDGDGDTDFAVGNSATHDVAVHVRNGAAFDTTAYSAPTGLLAVTLHALDADPLLDLVGLAGNELFVMSGHPAFGFAAPVSYPAGMRPERFVLADVNDDGLTDAAALTASDQLVVLLGRAQGGFAAPLFFGVGRDAVDLVAADLDNDGRLDLAVAQAAVPGLMLIFSDGDRFR